MKTNEGWPEHFPVLPAPVEAVLRLLGLKGYSKLALQPFYGSIKLLWLTNLSNLKCVLGRNVIKKNSHLQLNEEPCTIKAIVSYIFQKSLVWVRESYTVIDGSTSLGMFSSDQLVGELSQSIEWLWKRNLDVNLRLTLKVFITSTALEMIIDQKTLNYGWGI